MPKHDCRSSPVPLLACIHRAPARLLVAIVPVFGLMHAQQYSAKAHLFQPRMGQECVPLSLFWQLFLLNCVTMRGGKNKAGVTPSPTLLCCLQGSLLEGRSAQFMCIINTSTPSAPCGLSSRQPGKPNFSLKAGVLCLGLVVSQEKTIVTTLQKRFFDLLWSTDTSHTSSLAWKQHMLRLCPSLEEEKIICGKGKQRRIVCQPVEMCFFMREQSISD